MASNRNSLTQDSHARRTRLRRSWKPARPNIWRLSILTRLTWPSTAPERQGSVRSATTASPLALAVREHGHEGPDAAGQSVEYGAMRPDRLEVKPLGSRPPPIPRAGIQRVRNTLEMTLKQYGSRLRAALLQAINPEWSSLPVRPDNAADGATSSINSPTSETSAQLDAGEDDLRRAGVSNDDVLGDAEYPVQAERHSSSQAAAPASPARAHRVGVHTLPLRRPRPSAEPAPRTSPTGTLLYLRRVPRQVHRSCAKSLTCIFATPSTPPRHR